MQRLTLYSAFALCLLVFGATWASAKPASGPIIPNLPTSSRISATTVPPNGDVNPYGVAFVPADFPGGGKLGPEDVLVSNFNNNQNLQGTGTTIVRIGPAGKTSVFFQGPAGLGLDTALGVLRAGFVIVGSVPTTDGTFSTIQQGELLILDKHGNVVTTLSDPSLLDGPWDLTINDAGRFAQVFVSNVLSGTVTRLDLVIPRKRPPYVVNSVQIASGYLSQPNQAALVVGPTGLAYDAREDVLFVASTGDNAIFAITGAGSAQSDNGMGTLVYQDDVHLHGPLALVLAPNGDLITANGDAVNADPTQPSEIVEFTQAGQFVDQFSVDSTGEGGAFGIALKSNPVGKNVTFAAVDDIQNALDVWRVHT